MNSADPFEIKNGSSTKPKIGSPKWRQTFFLGLELPFNLKHFPTYQDHFESPYSRFKTQRMTQIWEKMFPIKKSEESHLHIAHWKRENLSSVFFHLYIFCKILPFLPNFNCFQKSSFIFRKKCQTFKVFFLHTGTAEPGSWSQIKRRS